MLDLNNRALIVTSDGAAFVVDTPQDFAEWKHNHDKPIEIVSTIPLSLAVSAPDLLAACHKALGELSTLAQDGPRVRLCETLRAAIAKAKP